MYLMRWTSMSTMTMRSMSIILLLSSASAFTPAVKSRGVLPARRGPVGVGGATTYHTTSSALRARRAWSEEELEDATSPPVVAGSPSSSAVDVAATAATLGALALFAMPELAMAEGQYPWAGPVRGVLDPALNLGQFLMLLRVVVSWYPEINLNKLPYNLFAWPTEPLLRPTRMVIPPAFGVDIRYVGASN
mmetsp:Transcript_72357/g.205803  ORF Transcript_72357/g.205803 Transcript_72357/m.205803 type:complete len:191 (-) Transcript_72357:2327-2899(-)